MSFASLEFIFLFLPITIAGFWVIQSKSGPAALWWLSAASVVFYIQWNPRDILIAGTSVTFNFWAARAILAGTRPRRIILALAITVNLLALAFYKYLGFIVSLGQGITWLDLPPPPHITLPLGISFFTFTQIAYLVDCHAKKINLETHRLRDYLLFVSFFPHSIAGPILHHKNLIPQFHGEFRFNLDRKLAAGLILFSIGLFKKTVFADNLATIADPAFAAADGQLPLSAIDAWFGLTAYSLQLYFDFSGYSDMAVGAALGVGMHIPFNFNSPYQASSIIDFWRRWHMSLSAFLRDYLYIPLGGNQLGTFRRYLNIFITMFLGGIWHGAGLNFVIWGALHGVFIVVNHIWHDYIGMRIPWCRAQWPRRAAGTVLTLLCVMVAWAFFRATTVGGAVALLKALSLLGGGDHLQRSPASLIPQAAIISAAALVAFTLPNSLQIHDWLIGARRPYRPAVVGFGCGAVAAIAVMFISHDSPFLYFQF